MSTSLSTLPSSLYLFDRKDDDGRGRHLVATKAISKGRLIFCERPLVALQSLGNPVWICHGCQAFVGGPHQALDILATRKMPAIIAGDDDKTKATEEDEDENDDQSSWKVVPCRYDCGQVYCSVECEADFWEARHQFLCTGRISAEEEAEEGKTEAHVQHPLIQFKQHAVTTNEIFLLVAEWLVGERNHFRSLTLQLQSESDGNTVTTNQLHDNNNRSVLADVFCQTNPYDDFCREPWWDIDANDKTPGDNDKMEEESKTKDILKQLCEEAARSWNDHCSLLQKEERRSHGKSTKAENNNGSKEEEQGMDATTTALHIAGIIGACELNSMGIRRRNPLCRDIFSQQVRTAREQEILKCLEQAGMIGTNRAEEEEEEEEEVIVEEEETGDNGDQGHANIGAEVGHTDGNENSNADSATGSMEADHDNKATEDYEEEEVEYTVDEIAGFLAGLDIYEEDTVKNDINNAIDNDENDDDADAHIGCGDSCTSEGGDQDDFDALFPPLDGTAMYALTCKMNHSCEPNVAVLYKTRGWGSKHPLVVHAVAIRDIKPGEELCISYIEEKAPREKRQEELLHYGFMCACTKCEREKDGPMEVSKADSAADTEEVEDLLFGSDDSDSCDENDDGSDDNGGNAKIKSGEGRQSDAPGDTNGEAAEGEVALENCLHRLDTVLNHSIMGTVPLPFLGPLMAFVFQTAVASQIDLDKEGTVGCLLGKCVAALRERDFVMAKSVGADLKRVLLFMLKKESQWPSTAYREAFWCAAVTAAVGLAHQCSFLAAISHLDEALILGLNRAAVSDFFAYVELHASQMAVGPCMPIVGSENIPDYTSQYFVDIVMSKGLTQPIQFPIPEYIKPDECMIQSTYFSKAKAVVVRKIATGWSAIHKWRHLPFFCRYYGHRVIPIELGSMRDDSGMKEELMTFRQFITKYLSMSVARKCWTLDDATQSQPDSVAYLAQHPLIQQLPGLSEDIDMSPPLCGSLGPSHIYLWIGTGGTRTPLHFDSYSNLFVQLVGVKYVRIYAENETHKLYVSKNKSYGLQGNMSDIDCEQEDFLLHPLAREAAYQEVVLFPGDSVYIPARAWHYVRSLSTSMSVNYWF